MNSQHAAETSVTARTDDEVKAAATRVLDDRGLEMQAFIVACLLALAADPDRFIATVRPHWPPAKARGRPPRQR
jgi:hypothetical protein